MVLYKTLETYFRSTVGIHNSIEHCYFGNYNIRDNNVVYKPQVMKLGAIVMAYAHYHFKTVCFANGEQAQI